jgi:hypothetical protein
MHPLTKIHSIAFDRINIADRMRFSIVIKADSGGDRSILYGDRRLLKADTKQTRKPALKIVCSIADRTHYLVCNYFILSYAARIIRSVSAQLIHLSVTETPYFN